MNPPNSYRNGGPNPASPHGGFIGGNETGANPGNGNGGGGFVDGSQYRGGTGQPPAQSPASASRHTPLTPEAQWAYLVNAAVTQLHLPPEVAALASTSELKEMLDYRQLHQPVPRTFPWEAAAREELIAWVTAHDPTAPPPEALASSEPVVQRRHAGRALRAALAALRAGEPVHFAADGHAGAHAFPPSGNPAPDVYVRPRIPGAPSPQNRPPLDPRYGYVPGNGLGSASGTPWLGHNDNRRVSSPYSSPATGSQPGPPLPFLSPPPQIPHGMSSLTSPYPVRQYLSPNGSTWIDGYITSMTPLNRSPFLEHSHAPALPPTMPLLPQSVGTPPVNPPPGIQANGMQAEYQQQQKQQQQGHGGMLQEDGLGPRRTVAAGEIPVLSEMSTATIPPVRDPRGGHGDRGGGGGGGGRRPPARVRPDVDVPGDRRREETTSERSRRHTNVALPPRKVQELLRKYEHDKSAKFTEWEIRSMEAYRRKQNHDARSAAKKAARV